MLSDPNVLPTFILFKAFFILDLNSLNKSSIDVIKGVIQLHHGVLILSIEQLVELFSPCVLYLVVFHQKSIILILDAFNLVEVSRLPLLECSYLICYTK